MAYVGSAYLNIIPKFPGLQSEIERALSSINTETAGAKAGKGYTSGLLSAGASIGLFSTLTSKALTVITQHVGDATSRFDTLNNYPRVMEALGYSSEVAEASIATMSDRLSSLPTTLDSMASTVQGIAAITGDLEQATSVGLAMNDMLLASGSSTAVVNSAMEQFRQMLAKGKPDLQDWRALVTAAPGQMNQLAKSMLGPTATADDLYAALGGGKNDAIISMDELMAKIVELGEVGGDGFESFATQAEAASGGVQTALANAGNAVTKGITEVMDAVGRENIVGVIDDVKDGIKSVSGIAADIAGDVIPPVKKLYDQVKPFAPMIATAVTAMAASKSGIGSVMGVVGTLSGKLKTLAKSTDVVTDATKLFGGAFDPATLAITGITAAIGIGVAAYTTWKKKTDDAAKATDGLMDAASDSASLGTLTDLIRDVGEASGTTALSLDELRDANARRAESMQEVADEAETEIAKLSTAQSIISEYAGQTDLSADAQGRLEWALGLVNEQFGLQLTQADVINGFYEDQDGNVQDLTQSVNDLTEAKKNELRVDAISENLTTAYEAQSDAMATLAQAQHDYNAEVQMFVDGGMSQAEAEATVNANAFGQALDDARGAADAADEAVATLEASLGDAAAATSEAADAYDEWGNGQQRFAALLTSYGTSLSGLKEDMRTLGVSTDDLAGLTDDDLNRIAMAYDGTASSIVDCLEDIGVGMDDASVDAVKAADAMEWAIRDLGDGIEDSLDAAGVDIHDFAHSLEAAGVSTETLNAIGSENLAALAQACGGNMDAMVWYIQNYNNTPIVDKDGNVNVDAVELIDAQGRVYTWNGSQLVDKDGNVALDGTELSDAQGNLWTWNKSKLQSKDGSVTITQDGVDAAIRNRDNWNNTGWLNRTANASVSITRTINELFAGANARGGIRPHADGGIRYHANGAIARSAVPLDIVGEDGAEAIVPLTNKRYSQPFVDLIADGVAESVGSDMAVARYVTQWLATSLPRIIQDYTPQLGERDFDRRVRRSVASA